MQTPQTSFETLKRRTITPQQLRTTRESWNMTQQELADVFEVSVATVCRWERQRLLSEPDLPGWLAYALWGYWRARQEQMSDLDTQRP